MRDHELDSSSFLSVFRRQLGIAVNFREAACFDVPPWRLAKEAFVFAVELTRTLVSDFERGTSRIDSLNQHSLACGDQSKLFLILKGAHRG